MTSIFLLQMLYGASVPICKYLLTFCPPIYFSGVRMTLAGLILLALTLLLNRKKLKVQREELSLYAQTALFGIYGKYILRHWGLQSMPAVKMGFLLNSTPFIAALFSYVYFGERLSTKQWLGLLIGVVGLTPLLLLTTPQEVTTAQLFAISLPELAILGAIVCHVYGLVTARQLVRKHRCSPLMVNGIRMTSGGSIALMTGMAVEGVFPIENSHLFFAWLFVLIVTSNVICQNLYLQLLKSYSVTFMSFTDFIGPLVIAFYSWVFLNESLSWYYLVSGVIVFCGLYLFYQDELRTLEIPS